MTPPIAASNSVQISTSILELRERRVILDSDLAAIYGVTTKRLNEQVKRNAARFPEDFMFRLLPEEAELLRSQFATSKPRNAEARGGARYLPFAFTEHGAIQAANVLNSSRAAEMSVYVVRAFVQLREVLSSNKELAARLDALESRIERKLTTHDDAIAEMLATIRKLLQPQPSKGRGIGFTADVK